MNKIHFLLFVTYIFSLSSCLDDSLTPADVFEGPSEYTVEFQSGSFTGKLYNLKSTSSTNDHLYLTANSIQKILSQPLEEKFQNALRNTSFVNWAWQADTITGVFPALNATDPNVLNSGNLQLIFTNGDELISAIPKGSLIDVTSFGGPQGAIEGSLMFTAPLDYRINGNSKRETASIFIGFKIKRGPNN